MTQEQNKQAHIIISYYQSKYKIKFNRKPVVNRNKLQYLILNVLRDLSIDEIKELVDFYISTDRNPSLLRFCYEYDEVLGKMNEESKDLEKRKALLLQTQKNVMEFRRQYGNDAQ
jgi:DNA/RNA-binding domain of Phe-tRNA-synthetase-like protein